MAGAPLGNDNAIKNKPWRDAIDWVLKNKKIGQCKRAELLRGIAEKLAEKALEGDMMAIRELGDRIDGKPVQGNTHSSPDGGPIEHNHIVEFIGVDEDSDC